MCQKDTRLTTVVHERKSETDLAGFAPGLRRLSRACPAYEMQQLELGRKDGRLVDHNHSRNNVEPLF